jgi:drug/metabolite transporter (DMT)-like permease
MNSTDKSYLFGGLSVLFWSTVATAFKIALKGLDFIQLIFFASAVTVILLFILLVIQGKLKDLLSQPSGNIVSATLLGVLNPAAYYLILFKAYSMLPAQVAQPVNMVWPIVLTFLSVPLLGQSIGRYSIAGLLISFAGVICISLQGGKENLGQASIPGVILALVSSIIWALYWIFNVRQKGDAIIKLFLNFLSGLIILTVIVIAFSDFRIVPNISFSAALYVGIFETGITYIFWMKAMQFSSNNAKTGNLIFLTPFLSLIFIRFVLKETLFLTTFIGLIFIIAGIFIQRFDRSSNKFHETQDN